MQTIRRVFCILIILNACVWLGAQDDDLGSIFETETADEPRTESEPVDEPAEDGLNALALPQVVTETAFLPEFAFSTMRTPEPRDPDAIEIDFDDIKAMVGEIEFGGYLSEPADLAPRASVLLTHEWWGLNEPLKEFADWLAGRGYRVLAVDLYGGQVAENRAQAVRLMRQLQSEESLTTLRAARDWLAAGGDAKPGRPADESTIPDIGLVGFGLGAKLALQLAMEEADEPGAAGRIEPAALVLFHAEPVTDAQRLAVIPCPVLGFYAKRDAWITPKKVRAFEQALGDAKIQHQTFSFDTQPGFVLSPDDFRAEAYKEAALDRLLDFLERHL